MILLYALEMFANVSFVCSSVNILGNSEPQIWGPYIDLGANLLSDCIGD